MKSFIYMNYNTGKEPGITVQTADKKIHANKIQIDGPSTVCSGILGAVWTHEVTRWIECDFDDITILE